MPEKISVDVSATLTVEVRFRLDMDPSKSLVDIRNEAKEAAERVALSVIGRGTSYAQGSVRTVDKLTVSNN